MSKEWPKEIEDGTICTWLSNGRECDIHITAHNEAIRTCRDVVWERTEVDVLDKKILDAQESIEANSQEIRLLQSHRKIIAQAIQQMIRSGMEG